MEGIHPNAKYRLVALARLVGMQLAVLVNSQHYQFVKNVSTDSVGTGLLGKMVSLIIKLFYVFFAYFSNQAASSLSANEMIFTQLTKIFIVG